MDMSNVIDFTDRSGSISDPQLGQHAAHRPASSHPQSIGAHLTAGSYVTNSQYQKEDSDSDDDCPSKPKYGKKTRGRVKVRMQFISDKLRRYTTFSKRKTGIMKKAYELSTLTGTQVMLLVASETGHVYTFATKKLQPMITSESGKALIQTCLNSPESGAMTQEELEKDRRMNPNGFEETELCCAAAIDEDDGTDNNEVHEMFMNGGELSESQPEHAQPISSTPKDLRAPPSTTSVSSTFNIHTIIPPSSNSDGTMGKVTNLSMQVPQSTSIPQLNMSLAQPQSHNLFSSEGSDTSEQMNSRPQLPTLDFQSNRQLQRQQEEQQQEIARLTQLNEEHRQQLQSLQGTPSQVVHQLGAQSTTEIVGTPQVAVAKPALLTVGGRGQASNALLYHPPENPTLVYAAAPTIPNQLTDGVAVVNIVTSQPQSYSTAQVGTIATPAPPHYITIPISQLANNPVMLQQVISSQQELGNKT
ncbi:serum response factor-like isoform X2 [Watersipora subatra]|uniref:serum response factor-like isoform X2 n=1 Tax=Watersipora subatra TaxID=2589382 RepID=UPI00355BA6F5